MISACMNASGCGISQMPIFVTMPKFDCEKMPSSIGSMPILNCPQVLAFGMAPIPVRMTSPLASTTSMPQWESKWFRKRESVCPTPWSSAFPSTLPQPGSGTSSHTFRPRSWIWRYRSK